MSVIKPWVPVKAQKIDSGYAITVLNRRYTIDSRSPMFSSIESCGEELLASPIRIVAKNNGRDCIFDKALTYMMEGYTDDKCTVISTMQSEYAIVNVCHTIEFDGCADLSLTVMPTGRSVAACFGLEKFESEGFDLDTLYIEVPLNKKVFKYFSVYPRGNVISNGQEVIDETVPQDAVAFKGVGVIPKGGFYAPFKAQVYLNGDDKGLGFFFDSNKNFALSDDNRVFELVDNQSEYILRIRIFDRTPDFWLQKGTDNAHSRDLIPISFRFGMQATPVKAFEKKPFNEKNLHIDCFKKVPVNYEDFLSSPVVPGNEEIGFDRIKRLGVDTLYIHEKWNDIQNSPELTEETAQRLKYIVEECHKRDIKIVPYFGYEISTLSPIYNKCGEKYCIRPSGTKNGKGNYYWHWYRYPWQRDERACPNSDFLDYFASGLIELQKKYGFDGFYFDSITSPIECANTAHGCGWTDNNGVVHSTYQNFAIRELFKKLYSYASENNLIINLHTNGVYTLSCIGFCTSLWEGETLQSQFLSGNISRLPEGMMRAMFSGRDTGIPLYTLCYSREGVWEFENAASIALLFGSIPKPVDIGAPLEYMSRIWNIFDKFPLEKSDWIAYYMGQDTVVSDKDDLKVSIYRAQNKCLAICSSVTMDFCEDVHISSAKYKRITDAFSGDVLSENGECVLHFGGFDCKILVMEEC